MEDAIAEQHNHHKFRQQENIDVVDFQAVDSQLEVFVGTFGLLKDGQAVGRSQRSDVREAANEQDDGTAARKLANSVVSCLKPFCSTLDGRHEADAARIISKNIEGILFEGAAYCQQASRMFP